MYFVLTVGTCLRVCLRLLVPLAVGTHITLLGKIPSPKILLKALEEIRPNLIICVPLILEKIYKKTDTAVAQ